MGYELAQVRQLGMNFGDSEGDKASKAFGINSAFQKCDVV